MESERGGSLPGSGMNFVRIAPRIGNAAGDRRDATGRRSLRLGLRYAMSRSLPAAEALAGRGGPSQWGQVPVEGERGQLRL
eukprot:3890171-Rhodomonas_salina.1